MEKITFRVKGMHCVSCEKIIKEELEDIEGITLVKIDHTTEKAEVHFNPKRINKRDIHKKINSLGYTCTTKKQKNIFGWLFGIIGLLIVGYFLFQLTHLVELPEISSTMSYSLLFLVGLLTGFHCISMCGGFVISYTTKDPSYKSHIFYGIGKTLSYTLIGAIFGLIGSIIAFTPFMRGIAGIIAGLFLIIFGLRSFLPSLRKISFKTPKFVPKLSKNSSPLVIGLLNGLMIACGPLQAIYIMAAGTGNAIEGGKLLFIFALGTLPVMLGFGFFTSMVSKKLTNKLIKLSGIIVIVLGIIMLNNGLALTGTGYDLNSIITSVKADSINLENSENLPTIEQGYQVIEMTVNSYGWTPDTFILKENTPVKWKINVEELTYCNNAIQVPSLNLEFDLQPGEQTIEFTPTKEGTISWSCWMGMIPGTFIVVEDLNLNEVEIQNTITSAKASAPSSNGCSCCGGR